MPLSVDSPIRNAEIYSFKELKPGKVFLLNGHQGDQLVVKNEYTGVGGMAPVKPSNTVMKVVDPRVKMKVLENGEVEALRSYATELKTALSSLRGAAKRGPNVDIDKAVNGLWTAISQAGPGIWMKMSMQQVQDLDHAVINALEVNSASALDPFITALTNKGGLEKLGEIVAADAFIGNTDRFETFRTETRQMSFPAGGKMYPFQFRALGNVGNVFIALDEAGNYTPFPLDFFDPNGPFQRFERLEATEANRGAWPGRVLVTRELRLNYARNIVADLENLLSLGRPAMILNRFEWTKLGRDASERMEKGMADATERIQARMQEKMAGKVAYFPDALMDRCRVLSGLDAPSPNVAQQIAAGLAAFTD
jgi:hypothetical protein